MRVWRHEVWRHEVWGHAPCDVVHPGCYVVHGRAQALIAILRSHAVT